jgi:methylenetetrahydrofolate dehydrogenase (NADP+)/methenyltetrahydrofolate cyclohydrolase
VQKDSCKSVLLQLPLQHHEATKEWELKFLAAIPPEKDADGLTAPNLGRVLSGESHAKNWTSPIPATPLGILRLLAHFNEPLRGKRVCVIGRSRLVGMPLAALCTHEGATVTLCHRDTQKLADEVGRADVLCVAAGSIDCVKPEWISSHQVIIDVGIHRSAEGQIRGDCSKETLARSRRHTPVPRGVGVLTVTALCENVIRLESARLRAKN